MIPFWNISHVSTPWGTTVPVYGLFELLAVVMAALFLLIYLGPKYGLRRDEILIGTSFAITFGVAFAHWIDLLVYRPGEPFFSGGNWLRLKDGTCSIGALAGGTFGVWLFSRLSGRPFPYLFAVGAEAAAFAWGFGRIGCALVHDHLGGPTTFLLGVRMPDGGTLHDPGLYECLYLGLVLTPYVWRRRHEPAAPREMTAAIGWLYCPARFLLDLLRLEPRYAGLTPAQWFCLGALAVVFELGRGRGSRLREGVRGATENPG